MSVGLGDALEASGLPPASVLEGHPLDFSLVALPARVVRAVEQAVCRDPLEDDPAHGLVVGEKTTARMRAMAKGSAWIVAPAGACEPPAV